MKIAVVCCMHGNEPYGLEVVKRLPASIPCFIANKDALKENRRYLDVDLNRCFPGDENGNREERIANDLKLKLKDFDYVIDLHSTSNDCSIFGIITNPDREKIEFARRLGLKKLVVMGGGFGNGKALIDHVKCGISLEVGKHLRAENVEDACNLIMNFLGDKNKNSEIEIYEVTKKLRKNAENILIKNFENVKKGQLITFDDNNKQYAEEDFTAVLVNEEAYEGVLCLMARKIKFINGYH